MFKLVAENLHYAEGPRWRDGNLYFSDFFLKSVMSIDSSGNQKKLADVPNQPSGLGWLPNGDMIVVSMLDRKLMKIKDGTLELYSDLSNLTPYRCNDMVIDVKGNAYVGNFGTYQHGKGVTPTVLIKVDTDGNASVVASKLDFPNGTVITPDGKKLIIGETYAGRLTSFLINKNGNLSNRRVWAQMIPRYYYFISRCSRFLGIYPKEGSGMPFPVPDGICLDEGMGVWVASPTTSEVIRYEEGGKITNRIATPNRAYACMLGGNEGKTLFVCTADTSDPEEASSKLSGKIYSIDVELPKVGCP